MDLIYWAALASFIAGVCGYIIARYWIVPIGRYRRIKQRFFKNLDSYAQKLPADEAAKPAVPDAKMLLQSIRQTGMQLIDIYNGELPYWYRLVLITRHESPLEVSDQCLRLGNMPNSGAARKCIQEIRRHFKTGRRGESGRKTKEGV